MLHVQITEQRFAFVTFHFGITMLHFFVHQYKSIYVSHCSDCARRPTVPALYNTHRIATHHQQAAASSCVWQLHRYCQSSQCQPFANWRRVRLPARRSHYRGGSTSYVCVLRRQNEYARACDVSCGPLVRWSVLLGCSLQVAVMESMGLPWLLYS